MISIHALREEGDFRRSGLLPRLPEFLSTPSARRATRRGPGDGIRPVHFYPRPPRGGRLAQCSQGRCIALFLSTPSARRATYLVPSDPALSLHFYPRPPRGGRLGATIDRLHRAIFLSTPSARRATAKTETKSLFSNKLYNILHEFRRALIYNGSKSYPNHAK